MKIGLWNIDHPEAASDSPSKQRRFENVAAYLAHADCDAYIITEANAAMELPGYHRQLSEVSPFRSAGRCYNSPNSYHQVAIYGRESLENIGVDEPVNGVRVSCGNAAFPLGIYGNVITIKDQWSKESRYTYADRLEQQLSAIKNLPQRSMIVAGDFNLKIGWSKVRSAHRRIKDELVVAGWIWPTQERDDTVQHVLHSQDLHVELQFDFSVKYGNGKSGGLSDHPYISITVSPAFDTQA